jgi:septum formation protein
MGTQDTMPPPITMWIDEQPLVLASRSAVRSALLSACKIPHIVCPADIDEREIENHADDPTDIAMRLAKAKAVAVSGQYPGHIVVGADQTCTLANIPVHKARTIEELRHQLRRMRGKTHILTSAAAIARDGRIFGSCRSSAQMEMINFSDDFLENYLRIGGKDLLDSVGGYQIEGLGVTLMQSITGDIHTVMGLPLIDLLHELRRLGVLQR